MRLIQLDELTINPHLSSVLIGEQEVSLDPKLLDLLLLLCHHKNQIVTRHQILESIWPNSIVTDNAVNKLVASLRKVLKDEPKSPKYIQTIPKRGYRLIASVEHIDNSEQDIAKNAVQDSRKNSTQTPATEVELNTPRAQETKTQETSTGILPRKFFALFAIGLLTAVAYIGLLWRPSPLEATSIQSTLLNTRELTRMPGLERSPLMSEDQSFIVYLRESPETGHRSLWRKELANEKETLIKGISPYVSRLVSIETEQKHWKLLYLAQENTECSVASVEISTQNQLANNKTLFDCSGQRIFDLAWSANEGALYYSAKANHESTSRIYKFDLASNTHQLITQPNNGGFGNKGVDLTPDGKKLLIVHLNNEYKSQLHVLNLVTNQLSSGLDVPYNIEKATWFHDSEQIMFHSPSPSNQILVSDINGSNTRTLIGVSEYLETEFNRIKNSRDILFSTTNLDFNNRWIFHVEAVQETNNSTVYDMQPTLAHNSYNYAFVSTRTGQEQLYYGDLTTGSSRTLSRVKSHRWLKHLSFSPSDKFMLAGDHSAVWLLNVEEQLNNEQPLEMSEENSLFSTPNTLLEAIWLNDDFLYFKIEAENKIKGYIFARGSKQIAEVDNRWQALLTDHKSAETLYMIDQVDTQIYQMPLKELALSPAHKQVKFPEHAIQAIGTHLPRDYYDLKIHDKKIYYVTASNSGNSVPYDYQIEVKPVYSSEPEQVDIYKTSCSCGYDIADSGFIVSELMNIEGDIHRTVH